MVRIGAVVRNVSGSPRGFWGAARRRTPPDTPAALRAAVAASAEALRPATGADWTVRAGGLEWDCARTAVHLADVLFSYAAQLATRAPHAYVPACVGAEDGATPDGLVEAVRATGTMLAAVAETAPPGARGYHRTGMASAADFAAMGAVEVLAHTHDLATGLGLDFDPPAGVCSAVLDRLFPGMPEGAGPWETFLWATGRGELPGLDRRTEWVWRLPAPADG
ncbi:maleylpyruvate isomerase N-terminal domain-containing protein [Streptomyces sp. NPDC051940]|uniref:maleylpyruvate isomerase N-terminal domain-containing protein n=1 Tax=Streptomyces sp. NPDC051940 TaxID=3155675 RepID=UPI0034498E68